LIFWLPGSTTFSGSTAAVEAGVSPPTGVVPGADVVEGVLVACPGLVVLCPELVVLCPVAGVDCPAVGAGVLAGAVVLVGVVCAQVPVARASDSPASSVARDPMKFVFMT
jgi:hypothetical protein